VKRLNKRGNEKMKILTAIYTDDKGNKNQIMTRNDYSTKKEFKLDLRANGFKNIRIHTEEDFNAMHKGFKSAADMKKYNAAMNSLI
jgi:hypothetical protein